jgi:DNA-binding MarR family transcriptional regulator
MSDLAGYESVGAPVATRVVDSLEKLGYMARVADPSDGRACLIELTDGGRSVLAELWSTRAAVLSRRISRLSTGDAQLLAAALPVLEALVRDTTDS